MTFTTNQHGIIVIKQKKLIEQIQKRGIEILDTT